MQLRLMRLVCSYLSAFYNKGNSIDMGCVWIVEVNICLKVNILPLLFAHNNFDHLRCLDGGVNISGLNIQ